MADDLHTGGMVDPSALAQTQGWESPEPRRTGRQRKRPTEVAQAKRRAEILMLWEEGMYQDEIGKHFGITQAAVSQQIQTAIRHYEQQAASSIERKRARMLAKIARIEAEAWDDLWASQEGRESSHLESVTEQMKGRKKKTKVAADGSAEDVEEDWASQPQIVRDKASTRTEGRSGSPAAWRVICWCNEQICKIEGLYKEHATGTGGVGGGSGPASIISPAERTARVNIALERVRARIAARGDDGRRDSGTGLVAGPGDAEGVETVPGDPLER